MTGSSRAIKLLWLRRRRRRRLPSSGSPAEVGPASATVVIDEHSLEEVAVVETEEVLEPVEERGDSVIDGLAFVEGFGGSPLEPGGGFGGS